MRIYIIGNNGVALPREAPGALNEGEIVVASNEELHAAPLSGKRLLAFWNALDVDAHGWGLRRPLPPVTQHSRSLRRPKPLYSG